MIKAQDHSATFKVAMSPGYCCFRSILFLVPFITKTNAPIEL